MLSRWGRNILELEFVTVRCEHDVCVCVCVFVEGDKVAQYAGLNLHKRIVNSHGYSKSTEV